MLDQQTNENNKNTLYQIMKKNFSFDKDSLEYIRKEIENPYIDPVYKELGIDEYGRKYIEIDPVEFEKQDISWTTFARFFDDFCKTNDVGYKHFLDNKVTVNKNSMKLYKAISSHYKKDDKRENLIKTCPSIFWDMDDNNIEFEQALLNCVNDVFEKKLSKKKTHLVLSFNLVDWFLCSSGENWRSCLALDDSEGSSMYWCAIPSLFSDKNRALMYVTNGQSSEVFGLTKDKMLNRTWTMLNNKDHLYIIRHYPNSNYRKLNYKELLSFPNEIYHMDQGGDSRPQYQGKHTIKPLISTFGEGKNFVFFPYLDYHKFVCRT